MDTSSNCQFNSRPQSSGFLNREKRSKIFKSLFTILLFFGSYLTQSSHLLAQTTDIASVTPFVVPADGCSQNNIIVAAVEFRDANGIVFNPNDLGDYDLKDEIEGEIWLSFQSGNGYNPHVQFDVFTNGIKDKNIANCVVFRGDDGAVIGIPNGGFYKVADFTWLFGDKLEIKNIYVTWVTGSVQQNTDCPTEGKTSQCFLKADGFVVNTPPVANFDFTTDCLTNKVDFKDTSTGGDPSINFTYTWDFDTSDEISSNSNLKNPSYTYITPGTYNVKLTIVKGSVTESITKPVIVYGLLGVTGTAEDDDCTGTNTGSIEITPTGGSAFFIYAWSTSDGSGFEADEKDQTGLSAGTYSVTVTDSRKCTVTKEFTILKPNQAPDLREASAEYCIGSLVGDQGITLVSPASGYTLLWYDEAGTTQFETTPTFNTDAAGVFTYQVSQIKDGECESDKVEVRITVLALPDAPVLTVPAPACDAATVTIAYTEVEGVEFSLTEDFTTLLEGGRFLADVASEGTVYAKTAGTECVTSSGFEVAPAPVTPDAPVLTVPAPACDAATVTITYTEVEGVEFSLREDFTTLLEGGRFLADVASEGTVYAKTAGTECVTSSGFEVAPAPVTPDAPVLTVPAPACDAATVTITYTEVEGVEFSLREDFTTLLEGGRFLADVASEGTVYAKTAGTECVTSSGFEVAPAPVTPDAPVLTVPAPACDAATVTITYTEVEGVEFSLREDFTTLLEGGRFLADVASEGTVYAKTAGTECVTSSGFEVAPAPVTPDAPVLTVPAPACDAATVTIAYTEVEGVEFSLTEDFTTLLEGGRFLADVASEGTVYAKTAGTECVTSSDYTVAVAPVTPAAPILTVPAPECDAETVTITFTAAEGVEYSTAQNFSTMITNGSFTANVNSSGTVYARTIGTTCVIGSAFQIAPAPVSPDAPISGGNQSVCLVASIQTLTATATVAEGISLVWYDAAIGGNVVADPSRTTVGSVTYYAESVNNETKCKSLTRTAVRLEILGAPAPPFNDGNITICEGDEAKITAKATGPGTIVWYDQATGGSVVADPSLSTVGTIIYYAQSVGASCSSLERTAVTLTINAAPTAPVSGGNQEICETTPFTSLTATATVSPGFSVIWYTTANGDATTESPSLTQTGTVTYYAASINNETECESLTRTPVTLTINAAPTAPVSGGNQEICETTPFTSLTATATVSPGFSVIWYTTANGDATTESPSLTQTGTVTYYAASINNETECESLTRTPVTLTINPAPTAPVSGGNQEICETTPFTSLTATATVSPGFSVIWYTTANGDATTESPSLTQTGTVTYYAASINNETECESLTRTPVTLTINASPNAPVSGGNQEECFFGEGQTLTATATTASGSSVVWYNAPTGGTVVNPVLSEVGTVTYYAEAVSNGTGCTSLERTPVTLTLNTCLISIQKTADVESVNSAGQVITYTLTVRNLSTIPLTNVNVTDPLTGLSQVISSIPVGGLENIVTTYTVTQEDIDSGFIDNTATATGLAGDTEVSDSDDLRVVAEQNPDITIVITDNDAEITEEGQEIVYNITVTNTGNVTLTNVTVVDTVTGLVINVGTLLPGQSVTVDTTPYPVSQEDVDNGSVINEASVTGESPNPGDDDPTDTDAVETPINQVPGITIVKTADKTEISELGEVVVYTLTVTNTGNVTLTDVIITDPLTGLNENIGTLLPGEVKVEKTSYTVTNEDLQKTTILNVATVKATPPNDETIGDESSVSVGVSYNEIIATNDEFGTYFLSYGGRLGNILDNDRLNGVRPNDADVDFEFTELDGIIGLLIDENGELNLIPGVNEAREYKLKYTLREVVNPNNSDDAFVVFRLLNDQVDLSVTKTSFEAEIFEGDEFEYEITLSNIGGTPASNVVLVDDLPGAVTYISSRVESVSSSQIQVGTPAVTGSRITWAIPFLPADGKVVIRVRVKAGAAGSITNVAKISASEDDTDEVNNQGSDVNQILPFHIPNVITPNNDGDNDTFEIQGLGKFASSEITIFNRYGDHVFEKKDYNNDWAAPGQAAGTYFYILTTVDNSGQAHTFKGWIQVIKD